MMNRKIAALTLASLLSCGALPALAAQTSTQASALPPAAMPGINQGQESRSKEDKANKKGEEASGSNSGTDPQTMEEESAATKNSKGSKDHIKKQGGNDSGG
jgi:hypothetical protein